MTATCFIICYLCQIVLFFISLDICNSYYKAPPHPLPYYSLSPFFVLFFVLLVGFSQYSFKCSELVPDFLRNASDSIELSFSIFWMNWVTSTNREIIMDFHSQKTLSSMSVWIIWRQHLATPFSSSWVKCSLPSLKIFEKLSEEDNPWVRLAQCGCSWILYEVMLKYGCGYLLKQNKQTKNLTMLFSFDAYEKAVISSRSWMKSCHISSPSMIWVWILINKTEAALLYWQHCQSQWKELLVHQSHWWHLNW